MILYMEGDIENILANQEFTRGTWIGNTRNYDYALSKIVREVGWTRENASSHDYVTSRGEKVEVKKFKNGNGWLACSNMAKSSGDVTYMIINYSTRIGIVSIYLIPITRLFGFLHRNGIDLNRIASITERAKCCFHGQVAVKRQQFESLSQCTFDVVEMCKATKKDSSPCCNMSLEGTGYCGVHKNMANK
jgi:hypothetical protein